MNDFLIRVTGQRRDLARDGHEVCARRGGAAFPRRPRARAIFAAMQKIAAAASAAPKNPVIAASAPTKWRRSAFTVRRAAARNGCATGMVSGTHDHARMSPRGRTAGCGGERHSPRTDVTRQRCVVGPRDVDFTGKSFWVDFPGKTSRSFTATLDDEHWQRRRKQKNRSVKFYRPKRLSRSSRITRIEWAEILLVHVCHVRGKTKSFVFQVWTASPLSAWNYTWRSDDHVPGRYEVNANVFPSKTNRVH